MTARALDSYQNGSGCRIIARVPRDLLSQVLGKGEPVVGTHLAAAELFVDQPGDVFLTGEPTEAWERRWLEIVASESVDGISLLATRLGALVPRQTSWQAGYEGMIGV